MRILFTNNSLDIRGGSESYLETVVTALRQLGHQVELFSPRCGAVAADLRGRGFRVHDDPSTLTSGIDVIHGQHAGAVALVRAQLPDTPLAFASHSWFLSIEDPVADLAASAFIAFNDVTLARLRAHGAVGDRPVHRLHQPVDISFGDRVRAPLPERASVGLVASRDLDRVLPELRTACERHGVRLHVVGTKGAESPDARREIRAADFVVAMGRTALEAMAAGRAVLVVNETARGGWVTDESYEGFEADGFTGYDSGRSREPLEALIGRYRPELGLTARSLVVRNHAAQKHVAELVTIYRDLIGSGPESARVDPQLAALSDSTFGLEWRAVRAEWALADVDRERLLLDHDLASVRAELAAVRGQIERMTASRSWRMTAPVRQLAGVARGRRSHGEPAP